MIVQSTGCLLMGSMSFSISFLPNALILLRAIHGWTSAWPSTVRSSSVWNVWQWNVALHGIATKLKAQNCTKMRRLSSSSCWSLTCRSKAPGQLGGVKDNCRTLNIDECQQTYWSGRCWLSTHQSTPIISKRNVSSPIHTISYSYFYALALIHSALCRPSQVLLKRNLSHELSRQLWTQLLIHPWLDRRSDVDVLHAWEKRNSFLRDQEDQEDHELTS